MKFSLLLVLLSAGIVLAGLWPNVRIDHNDIPTNWMQSPAITLGPQTSSGQPIYVAFQKDSLLPTGLAHSASIMFQKSTDGGRTWLPQDVLVQRGSPLASWPDIVTDSEGNIYIVYLSNPDSTASSYDCVRSSDGGSTWSAPVSIDNRQFDRARIAVDSSGTLFVAWAAGHVYSSVSTDKGLTWSPRVRVDDDTVRGVECCYADAYVQPGTNHYLVAASAPYHHSGGYIAFHSYLYRSIDMGRTFEPGVQLDSLGGAFEPHVVADAQHIICDYTGESELPSHNVTEARTYYALSDTWGSRVLVTELDTPYATYYQGSKLAISADGSVHTALLVLNVNCDTFPSLAYYTYSSDHGASWSDRVLVSDSTTSNVWDVDIGVDSSGHAYVVWKKHNVEVDGEIWFATNNPLAIAEQPMKSKFNRTLSVEPNPFTRNAAVAWSPSLSSRGTLRVYAQDGRLVRQAEIPVGTSRWVWDGRDDSGALLPPGVYVLQTGPGLRAKVVKLK